MYECKKVTYTFKVKKSSIDESESVNGMIWDDFLICLSAEKMYSKLLFLNKISNEKRRKTQYCKIFFQYFDVPILSNWKHKIALHFNKHVRCTLNYFFVKKISNEKKTQYCKIFFKYCDVPILSDWKHKIALHFNNHM